MSAWEQLLAAGGVILLAVALRLAARSSAGVNWWQRGLRSQGSLIEAVDQLSLTPQHSMHVVRFSGKLLLVAVHSGGVVLVDTEPSTAVAIPVPAAQAERNHR